MPTLSLAMIVKNEEETLGRILHCVQSICDELVIVDTGSTDKTVEIAQSFGAKVFHFPWCDDFSAARNYSFEQCTGDWILWLDADDVILPEAQEKILALKQSELTRQDIDGVFMTYNYVFDESGQCIWTVDRERIIRNNGQYCWVGRVYEYVNLPKENALLRLDIFIEHQPTKHQETRKVGRNIDLFLKAIAQGDRSVRTYYYLAEEFELAQRYEEAVQTYQTLLTLEDADRWQHYHALVHIGLAQFALGQEQEALMSWMQAILLDSERAEAYNALGKYYYRNQQWKKAIPFFRQVLMLDLPEEGYSSPLEYRVTPCELLSDCYANLGHTQKAVEQLEQVLEWTTGPDQARLIEKCRDLKASHSC